MRTVKVQNTLVLEIVLHNNDHMLKMASKRMAGETDAMQASLIGRTKHRFDVLIGRYSLFVIG